MSSEECIATKWHETSTNVKYLAVVVSEQKVHKITWHENIIRIIQIPCITYSKFCLFAVAGSWVEVIQSAESVDLIQFCCQVPKLWN